MPPDRPQGLPELRLESDRRLAMIATSLMLLPGVLWVYVDVSLVADPLTRYVMHSLRASQLLLWVLGVYYIRQAPTRVALQRLLFLLALAIVAFITANSWLRPETNWMPLRTIVLISIGTFVIYPYRFRYQMIAWLALLASALSLMFGHYRTMPDYDRVSAILNILIAGALGMVVARSRTALDGSLDAALERERAAVEAGKQVTAELATLQGIIPICMYCHEVRTEAGAWEKLDQYVRQRTEADFSHGICPNCMKLRFPEDAEPSSAP